MHLRVHRLAHRRQRGPSAAGVRPVPHQGLLRPFPESKLPPDDASGQVHVQCGALSALHVLPGHVLPAHHPRQRGDQKRADQERIAPVRQQEEREADPEPDDGATGLRQNHGRQAEDHQYPVEHPAPRLGRRPLQPLDRHQRQQRRVFAHLVLRYRRHHAVKLITEQAHPLHQGLFGPHHRSQPHQSQQPGKQRPGQVQQRFQVLGRPHRVQRRRQQRQVYQVFRRLVQGPRWKHRPGGGNHPEHGVGGQESDSPLPKRTPPTVAAGQPYRQNHAGQSDERHPVQRPSIHRSIRDIPGIPDAEHQAAEKNHHPQPVPPPHLDPQRAPLGHRLTGRRRQHAHQHRQQGQHHRQRGRQPVGGLGQGQALRRRQHYHRSHGR